MLEEHDPMRYDYKPTAGSKVASRELIWL